MNGTKSLTNNRRLSSVDPRDSAFKSLFNEPVDIDNTAVHQVLQVSRFNYVFYPYPSCLYVDELLQRV